MPQSTVPTFPVMLTVSQMEQSMYTLEMCVTTLMQNTLDNPMKPSEESEAQTMVYKELLDTTTQLRAALTNLGVQLEPPLYQVYMQSDHEPMRLQA